MAAPEPVEYHTQADPQDYCARSQALLAYLSCFATTYAHGAQAVSDMQGAEIIRLKYEVDQLLAEKVLQNAAMASLGDTVNQLTARVAKLEYPVQKYNLQNFEDSRSHTEPPSPAQLSWQRKQSPCSPSFPSDTSIGAHIDDEGAMSIGLGDTASELIVRGPVGRHKHGGARRWSQGTTRTI